MRKVLEEWLGTKRQKKEIKKVEGKLEELRQQVEKSEGNQQEQKMITDIEFKCTRSTK